MYPLLFRENLHEIVWGGSRLKTLKGLPADGRNIGESWEISAVRGSESVVQNGELAGSTLSQLVERYGAELMGHHIAEAHGTEFPLLVKFIDAAGDLSIQVHPNDELARARHGKLGKTEMWYVMDARPGATLLAGFRKQIRPEEYAQKVADGSIVDVLARHEVHPGDVFFIPAGRVHAICRGILLCEIQQSSDVTYRLYDYNRLGLDGKPRQLHTEEARDAIDYKVYEDYRTHYTPVAEGAVCIVDCPFFVVNVVSTSSQLRRNLLPEDSFVTLSCLSGACVVRAGGVSVSLGTGSSCLIPASVADFEVAAFGGREVRLLESWAR